MAQPPLTPQPPASGLRLGMIEAHYPRATGTFFQREIDGLAENGIEVQTFVLHAYDDAAWRDPAVLALCHGKAPDRTRVHYASFFLSNAVWQANLRALARKPQRYLAALGTLLRHLSPRPLVSLKMLALFPKAVYFAAEADRLEIDHLCAFWANHCATVAFVMQALMDRPVQFSTYAHAGTDLYRDQSFLREKLQAAAAVFAVCDFNRRWLVERYPEVAPKIRVHHLGLDLEQYRYHPTPRVEPKIVAVGGLERAKGFHVLVEACARLRDQGVMFQCDILGEGPQRRDLEARVRRHGLEQLVSLPGQQAHPLAVAQMRSARLLAHPSIGLGDGVPTAIKEAAALETPVVATHVVGIPELVADGETGLLVAPNDPDALAAAMARLLADPELAARLAAAGRARAERMFNIHTNAAQLARELLHLAGRKSVSVADPAGQPHRLPVFSHSSPVRLGELDAPEPGE